MADWYTIEEAREDWIDAPEESAEGDVLLQSYLDAAQEAILAYAPARYSDTESPADPTEGMRRAHLLQAQNVWNAASANPAGTLDNGAYGLTTHPLDWQVRQLIRPKQGKPVIA